MKPHPEDDALHPDYAEAVREIFEEKIVFNRLLGLKLDELNPKEVVAHLEMRHELIGHYAHKRMHGGVISAALDALGGLAVMACVGARHRDEPVAQQLARFNKLGTIDLRIDYLRPAIGQRFDLRARVLRLGSRVASTRMEFFNVQGEILAAGAAAYIVS